MYNVLYYSLCQTSNAASRSHAARWCLRLLPLLTRISLVKGLINYWLRITTHVIWISNCHNHLLHITRSHYNLAKPKWHLCVNSSSTSWSCVPIRNRPEGLCVDFTLLFPCKNNDKSLVNRTASLCSQAILPAVALTMTSGDWSIPSPH